MTFLYSDYIVSHQHKTSAHVVSIVQVNIIFQEEIAVKLLKTRPTAATLHYLVR